MKKIKSLIALTLITCTLSTAIMNINPMVVHATPSITQTKKAYKDVKKQIEDYEEKISILDNNIVKIIVKIDTNKKQINKLNKEINITQKKLQAKEKELNFKKKVLSDRMRYYYMNGNMSLVEMVVDFKNLPDFLEKVEYLKCIVKHDNKIVEEVKKAKEEIENKKEKLIKNKQNVDKMKKENEIKLKQLNNDKTKQKKILENLNKKKEKYSNEINTYNRQQTLSRGGVSPQLLANYVEYANASNSDIIKYGSQFLGIKYVWGGTSPSGFDCSGLTQYVFNHFGIGLPRVAEDQQRVGQNIPLSELQPGDLLFFGSPAHHVGIYAGGGTMLHAPHTGSWIQIAPINLGRVTNARRVR